MPSNYRSEKYPFLTSDGGITGGLFRSIDWDRHAIGPVERWPASLKIALGILFSSKQPMFIFWGPEHIQFYNDGYLPSFGIGKHPEAMGQRGEECWPEIWSTIHPQIIQSLSAGECSWHEDQLLRMFRNGKLEDVYWTYGYSPIADEFGGIGGVLVTCMETTASVLNLAKVSSSQKDLFDFFMQAPVPMVILDGKDHLVTLANPPYEKFAGRPVVGLTLADAFPGGEADSFIPLIRNVYETGVPFLGKELPVQLPDGRGEICNYWVDVQYHPFKDQDETIRGVFALVHDVTDQVKSRHELKKTAEILDGIMVTSPDLIYVKDREGRMVYCNPTTLKCIGKTSSQVYGKTDLEFLGDEASSKIVMHTGERIMSNVRGETAEESITWADGSTRLYLSRKEPRLDKNGQVDGLIGISTDCTELKTQERLLMIAKEEAEKANSSKSAFLANMSHEIRTPLGAIMGFVDLIKDKSISRETLDDYLAVVTRNSSQLLRIIDDILDLSKVEAGMIQLEHIKFSLIELLADFNSLMGFRAREKGIIFDINAPTMLPEFVISDPTRIRQILSNVVGNAIKFTEKGRIGLSVTFGEGVLAFKVSDTGRGISNDQESALFQPFSQGDVSITRKFGGTGLGLVLTKRLAEALGGDFKLIQSTPGLGSTFLAHIKVEVSDRVDMKSFLGYAASPHAVAPFVGQFEGLSILLVEDSPDNQALISIILKKSGASVDLASDGAQGAKLALNGSYDVVLMDVQMPVMDGISSVKLLRQSGYTKPVIALTAHAMKEERERCLAAGFTEFLSKPIQRDALFAMLSVFKGPSLARSE